MMKMELIRKTEAFLKEKFDEGRYFSAHPLEKAYRLEHTWRVANIGRKIAAAEGFDETEMVIACLLHDISYCQDMTEEDWRNHGRISAKIARPFLETLSLPPERLEDICYGIAIHVDEKADFPGRKTAFAMTVCEADNIDRFDVYRIHENLSNDGFLKMPFSEKQEYVKKRLARLRELIEIRFSTRTAQEIWTERLQFYILFFEKLAEQLDNSCGLAEVPC